MTKRTILLALTAICFLVTRADVRVPLLFADHMVLQRDQPIPVWGWADPGEKIELQFGKEVKTTTADANGHWMIHLDTHSAGGPYKMTITGTNSITISDILVGEVWLCSGQSNMEFRVRDAKDATREIAGADYPQIRQFEVKKAVGLTALDTLAGGNWQVSSPATVGDFTAVGFFYARELYRQLHIPIGLINSTWGGTHVETWTSVPAFQQSGEFKDMIAGMPTAAEMAEQAASAKKVLESAIIRLQGALPPVDKVPAGQGFDTSFADPAFNDARWPRMNLPVYWEHARLGLDDLDGVVWFRMAFAVANEDAGKAATIELGPIDDSDDSYVNGVKIGSTFNKYAEKRVYSIPAGILKAGRNVIAIRVEDTGGGGGIYGQVNDMHCKVGDRTIPLAGLWAFHIVSYSISSTIGPNSAPSLLFNAMINPLIPYGIKGAIWYQGESNAERAFQYRKAFPLMITDWRNRWKEGNFPFYFVQLSSYDEAGGNSAKGSSWAELREAQKMTLALPATGMAVTTDIGLSHNIHPTNKQDVGRRLAAIALNDLYGKKGECSGPVYESFRVDGNVLILHFSHTGKGLTAHDPAGDLKGFEIAGTDHVFHVAKATLVGDTIFLFQDGINTPVAARYGWADDAGESNLFNKDGFPASPFRTDEWPGITDKDKYVIGK